MEDKRPNVILEKTINFSLEIISYCEGLESERKYVIARQLLKSGTSMVRTFMKRKTLNQGMTSFIK